MSTNDTPMTDAALRTLADNQAEGIDRQNVPTPAPTKNNQ
jgi:hypothetical protein